MRDCPPVGKTGNEEIATPAQASPAKRDPRNDRMVFHVVVARSPPHIAGDDEAISALLERSYLKFVSFYIYHLYVTCATGINRDFDGDCRNRR